jgi:hypothetical protein
MRCLTRPRQFTANPSQIIASTSSRLRRWQTELNHSSPLKGRDPLHTLQELGGYVKLNYFCHGSIPELPVLLPPTRLTTDFNVPAIPIRADSEWNRSTRVFSDEPYTARMTSSTCCCSLSCYTKLDSWTVVSDAAGCHLIVKRMFCEYLAHKGQ